jgi:hypothetical protein
VQRVEDLAGLAFNEARPYVIDNRLQNQQLYLPARLVQVKGPFASSPISFYLLRTLFYGRSSLWLWILPSLTLARLTFGIPNPGSLASVGSLLRKY